jgi:hypothetical protein
VQRSLAPILGLLLLACGPKLGRQPTVGQLFTAHDRAVHADQVPAPEIVSVTLRTTLQGQGMVTTTRIVVEQPDHLYTRTEIPGAGSLIAAYDGETAWTVHPLTGPALVVGAERDGLVAAIEDMRTVKLSAQYPEATLVGLESFQGEEAWRVEATTHRGQPTTLWFSPTTGRKVGDRSTGGGAMEITQVFLEYGEFGGLGMPIRTQQIMGQMVMVSEVVAFQTEDVDLPDFSPPPEVRALMEPASAP